MSDAFDDNAVCSAYILTPPVTVFALPERGNSTQNDGVRTGAGEFILRTYRPDTHVDTIRYEHHLLRWLGNTNLSLAVPTPIATRQGDTLVATSKGWHALFPRLPGVRPARDDLRHVAAFGNALGELHVHLAAYPTLPRPGIMPLGFTRALTPGLPLRYLRTQDDHHRMLSTHDGQMLAWWQEECTQVQAWAERHYQTLPWHVIHNDYIPNNTLLCANRVTAILDFEFATPDVRVLDLAIGLRNLLRVWEPIDLWATVQQFCASYCRWIPLSEAEMLAVPWLIRLRNSWLLMRRMHQAPLADLPSLQPIAHAQVFANWLAANEPQLVETIRSGNA